MAQDTTRARTAGTVAGSVETKAMASLAQPKWVEYIRGAEHLFRGQVAEAKRLGLDSPDSIRALRKATDAAQILAYLRETQPRIVEEAEVVIAAVRS